jgi:DNA helicase-2/ATP-dependent DNA helicase PcrA
VVFLTNLAKDRFPLYRGGVEPLIPPEFIDQYRDLFENGPATDKEVRKRKKEIKKEEERRLAYVALTRAKEHLFLTFGKRYRDEETEPSEFLSDIGYDFMRRTGNPAADHITIVKDTEIKVREMVKDTELEREKALRKRLILESLDSGDLEEVLKNTLLYQALKLGKTPDFKMLIDAHWSKIDPAEDADRILAGIREEKKGLKFNPDSIIFSHSSISTYEKCPKHYELAELLRMPTRDSEDTSNAMKTGSFVHKVLERAVREKIRTKEQLYWIKDSLAREPEWQGVDIEATTEFLDVFWERNRTTIKNNLMVEKRFIIPLGGFNFKGIIDRVDLIPETENEVEIIDYKTGKEPGTDERSKQMLLYARGLEHIFPQYKVKRIKLELLGQPQPRTFELNSGRYECIDSSRVQPLDESAMYSMIETAKQIAHDYEHGFSRTKNENACRSCGYNLYCGDEW